MNGRTHLVMGLAVGTLLATQIHPDPIQQLTINAASVIPQILGVVAAAGVGSLLPDIDHPQSLISGWIPGAGLLRFGTRHRGLTHSLFFILLIVLIAYPSVLLVRSSQRAIGNELWFLSSFIAGILSHLALDMLTPEGIQLFYPWRGYWRVPIVTLIPVWIWESVLTTAALGVIAWGIASSI